MTIAAPAYTMDVCICHSIRRLTEVYDDSLANELLSALNSHLRDIRAILSRSKSLSRGIQYQITPSNQRTMKALCVNSIDLTLVNRIYDTFKADTEGFWSHSEDASHIELRRRLACVVIFLRSKLDADVLVPPQIAELFQVPQNYADLRNFGRKYIKIARKLGGLGALFWLPLDIPHST